jgi:hypothetical protein
MSLPIQSFNQSLQTHSERIVILRRTSPLLDAVEKKTTAIRTTKPGAKFGYPAVEDRSFISLRWSGTQKERKTFPPSILSSILVADLVVRYHNTLRA